MISVCTVILHSELQALNILLSSLKKTCSLIQEIIVADVHPKENILIDSVTKIIPVDGTLLYGHANGLHACLRHAKAEYVLLTDPDVFYTMPNVDRFYIDAYNKFQLSFIGVSHYRPIHAFGNFPTVTSLLTRRCRLPPEDYFSTECNSYLHQTKIKSRCNEFPNPKGRFDVGCNLYLWNKDIRGRWISFLGKFEDGYRYHATSHAKNFKMRVKLGNTSILYHASKAFIDPHWRIPMLDKKWSLECKN